MTYEEIEIKNAKVKLSIIDGRVFDIRIEGRHDIEINNTLPLGKGKMDERFNTLDYKIKVQERQFYPVEISIIKWN